MQQYIASIIEYNNAEQNTFQPIANHFLTLSTTTLGFQYTLGHAFNPFELGDSESYSPYISLGKRPSTSSPVANSSPKVLYVSHSHSAYGSVSIDDVHHINGIKIRLFSI